MKCPKNKTCPKQPHGSPPVSADAKMCTRCDTPVEKPLPLEGVVIAVDFDGTCVTHEFPAVGQDIGAAPVLLRLTALGARLILWTMRNGDYLKDAVRWFNDNGIDLWAVDDNPEQWAWTASRKVFAHVYVDDMAMGTPLVMPAAGRPYVDWPAMWRLFAERFNLEEPS